MPWTVENPPPVAENWTEAEQRRCVEAANAVLEEGGTEEEAIFGCIHAAGRSERNMSEESTRTKVATAAGKSVVRLKSDDDFDYYGGYGVVWGGEDLEGEHFTPETDFWFDKITETPMNLYDHGYDKTLGWTVLGKTVAKTVDDFGLWIEMQVNRHQEYAEWIAELVDRGVLGISSGAAGHLIERSNRGQIMSWPIVEFSFTPTPAEPRTLGISELRSLLGLSPEVKAVIPEDGGEPSEAATEGAETSPIDERLSVSRRLNASNEVLSSEKNGGGTMGGENTQAQTEQAVEFKLPAEMTAWMKKTDDTINAVLDKLESGQVKSGAFAGAEGGDHEEAKSFGNFLIALRRNDHKRLSEVYKAQPDTKAALAEESGPTGGYLVPEEFVATLLQVAAEQAAIRSRAYIQPMASETLTIPMLNQTTAPTAGQTAFFGGVVASWTSEAATITETEPTFKDLNLRAHKLAGYTLASNEMLADSAIALDALLTRLFGGAVGWFEDYGFLRGTGAGQPLGIMNAGALLTQVRATAAKFALADAAGMLAKLVASSWGKAVWLMNQTVIPQLVQLADANANVVWIANMRDNLPATLFGLPVAFTEKTPALGTEGDVLLIDPSYYVVGDRQMLSIAFSEHYKFINDQGTWRFTHRVDGQPWLDAAITLSDASTQVSPFVALTDAA